MKDGLEEFLKRIEAKPTNETLIDRFMTLVLEVDGVDRILYLKKLVGLLLNSNPYIALKAAYVELQEARKEKLSHEYEVGALKDVESCFMKLGRSDNAALVREEINKKQGGGGAKSPDTPPGRKPPPKKVFDPAEGTGAEFGQAVDGSQPSRGSTQKKAVPSEQDLDAFDESSSADPLRDEPLPAGTLLENSFKSPESIAFDTKAFGEDNAEITAERPAAAPKERTIARPAPAMNTKVGSLPANAEATQNEPIPTKSRSPESLGTSANRVLLEQEAPAPAAVDSEDESPDDIFSMKFEYTKRSKIPELLEEEAAGHTGKNLGNFSAADLADDGDGLPHVPAPAPNFMKPREINDEPTNPRLRPGLRDGEGTAIISVESLQESMKQMSSVAKAVAPEYEFRTANDDSPDYPVAPFIADDDEDVSNLYFAPDDDPVEESAGTGIGTATSEASMFRGSPPPPIEAHIPPPEATAFLDLGAIEPRMEMPAPPVVQAPIVQTMPPPKMTPAAPVVAPAAPAAPVTSDEDWKLFQERLKMLSGFEIGQAHAAEFVRRLLRATKETAEVQDTLNLLIGFIEKRMSLVLKRRICIWLFEQLPPDAVHDLMESMTLNEECLRFYGEYLGLLYEEAQYRRLLRVVRDIVKDDLPLSWYKESYKYLPQVWENLGMEGWSWSEEEGGQAFCEQIVKRENPSLALLLA